MNSILKSILKVLPITTIIGYFFPDTLAKYQIWLGAKTPENAVALGETAANELAQHFKPELVAPLAHYEEIANPVINATIAAIEVPTVQSVELAITEAVGLGANLLSSKATPEEIQTALANLFDVINKEIGA